MNTATLARGATKAPPRCPSWCTVDHGSEDELLIAIDNDYFSCRTTIVVDDLVQVSLYMGYVLSTEDDSDVEVFVDGVSSDSPITVAQAAPLAAALRTASEWAANSERTVQR